MKWDERHLLYGVDSTKRKILSLSVLTDEKWVMAEYAQENMSRKENMSRFLVHTQHVDWGEGFFFLLNPLSLGINNFQNMLLNYLETSSWIVNHAYAISFLTPISYLWETCFPKNTLPKTRPSEQTFFFKGILPASSAPFLLEIIFVHMLRHGKWSHLWRRSTWRVAGWVFFHSFLFPVSHQHFLPRNFLHDLLFLYFLSFFPSIPWANYFLLLFCLPSPLPSLALVQ